MGARRLFSKILRTEALSRFGIIMPVCAATQVTAVAEAASSILSTPGSCKSVPAAMPKVGTHNVIAITQAKKLRRIAASC
jgi:hypothetical protein